MSIAPRETKCVMCRSSCAGQESPLVHRWEAPSRSTLPPHTGHFFGISNGSVPRGRLVLQHLDHFWNHVAGAPHAHRVADAHVLAIDLVLVVERRAAHRHARDVDRLQRATGVSFPGAPDLHHECRAPW